MSINLTQTDNDIFPTLVEVATYYIRNNLSHEDFIESISMVASNNIRMVDVAWNVALRNLENTVDNATSPDVAPDTVTNPYKKDILLEKDEVCADCSTDISETVKEEFNETNESGENYPHNGPAVACIDSVCFTLPIHNLATSMDSPIKERKEVIVGLLRKGEKAMLAAESKGGKSMLVMEMTVSVANGIPWLGFDTIKGKVLYVNMELTESGCLNRFKKIVEALKLDKTACSNIDICNLRGQELSITSLVNDILEYVNAKAEKYSLICIDPIYLLLEKGESDVESVNKFIKALNRLSEETNAAIIYTHHHSKGSSSEKNVKNRASGSGCFVRDIDCLIDIMPIDKKSANRSGPTAWRAEFLQRDYEEHESVKMLYDFPLHYVDAKNGANSADTYNETIDKSKKK